MCIRDRVFGNNVKLCIENYNNALKLFEEGSYYRDAYVVLLNICLLYTSTPVGLVETQQAGTVSFIHGCFGRVGEAADGILF